MAAAGFHWHKSASTKTQATALRPEPKPEPEPERAFTFAPSGQGAMFGNGEDLPMFTGTAYGGEAPSGMEPSRLPQDFNPTTAWMKRSDAARRKADVRTAWGR